MKHTPGPWHFINDENITCTVMDSKRQLILAQFATPEDALLGASSPMLAKAVEELLDLLHRTAKPASMVMADQDTMARARLILNCLGHVPQRAQSVEPLPFSGETSDRPAKVP